MFCISPIWALNWASIVVIFYSIIATSTCFIGRVVGLSSGAGVGAYLGGVEVNAEARTIVVLSIISDKIATISIDFLLLELFCFCFQVLAFKVMELGYPEDTPNALDFISEISLSSKPKTISLCNLAASNISATVVLLFFTCSSKSVWTVFIYCTNCSTTALKSSYFTWVPKLISSSTNLSIQAFTHHVTVFLGSIWS